MNNVWIKNVSPSRGARQGNAGAWRYLIAAFVFCAVLGLSACDSDGEETANSNGSAPASSGAPQGAPTGPAGTSLTIKTVTASKSIGANQPANAMDRNLDSTWGSGDYPPQWVQLDLGQPGAISKVRLNVSQTPIGPTRHEVYGGPTPDQLTLLGTLEGVTQDKEWLELNTPGNDVRYIKINTVKSPSWVSWREVEVYK